MYRCIYCGENILGNKHSNMCPYNPIINRKIVLFIKAFLLKNSKYNKGFTPFPPKAVFDKFCRENKIMRLKTIRRHYITKEHSYEEWLTELIDIAIRNILVTEDEFSPFLQFVYDARCFKDGDEYRALYEEAMAYEDTEFDT